MARRKNSELTPPPTGGFSWESRTITRLGLSAALVSASLGILFAVLQAQGWTVPKPLALVALLGVVIVVAATWFLFEVLRALRRLYEHLLTTPSWVESDPPGQLDFPVDGNRSLKRFTKELKRLTKPTKRLNRRIVIVTRLLAISANWDARIKRLVANLPSKHILRNGVYIQKRAELFGELVRDVHRNYEGFLSIMPLDTDEEVEAAKGWRSSLRGMHEGTADSIRANTGYRDSVRDLENQNLSRALRLACKKLADGLDSVVLVFRQHEKRTGELLRVFDQRLDGRQGQGS